MNLLLLGVAVVCAIVVVVGCFTLSASNRVHLAFVFSAAGVGLAACLALRLDDRPRGVRRRRSLPCGWWSARRSCLPEEERHHGAAVMARMIDLDLLEALARAATPGPWHWERGQLYDAEGVSLPGSPENDDHIVSANPAAVLELIAEVRMLRGNVAAIIPASYEVGVDLKQARDAAREVACDWERRYEEVRARGLQWQTRAEAAEMACDTALAIREKMSGELLIAECERDEVRGHLETADAVSARLSQQLEAYERDLALLDETQQAAVRARDEALRVSDERHDALGTERRRYDEARAENQRLRKAFDDMEQCAQTLAFQRDTARVEVQRRAEDRVVAAWLLDRAEQYRNDTCCRAVFDELMQAAAEGAHRVAHAHGELDDLLKRRFIVDATAGDSTKDSP